MLYKLAKNCHEQAGLWNSSVRAQPAWARTAKAISVNLCLSMLPHRLSRRSETSKHSGNTSLAGLIYAVRGKPACLSEANWSVKTQFGVLLQLLMLHNTIGTMMYLVQQLTYFLEMNIFYNISPLKLFQWMWTYIPDMVGWWQVHTVHSTAFYIII